MIDKAHERPVSRQAKLLKISRRAVYYLPKPVSPADLALMRHIDQLHLEHPFMGAKMLRDQLGLLGLHVGRRHVRTLMWHMDIQDSGQVNKAFGHGDVSGVQLTGPP